MISALEAWSLSGLALFVAAAISVHLVGTAAARIERYWRSRRYARASQRQVYALAEIAGPSSSAALVELAKEPAWFRRLQDDLIAEDELAKHDQRLYHACVARCVAVLSVGVVIMCASAIIFRDWSYLKKFATHFDLIATLYALGFFIAARRTNRLFVIKRSLIETLRAWQHLALVFALEGASTVDAAYQEQRRSLARRFEARRPAPSQPDHGKTSHDPSKHEIAIYRSVEQSWMEIEERCRSTGLRRNLSPAELGFYLKERPLEQLKYFMKAQGRIHDGQRSREGLMILLYIGSVTLAVLKALAVFQADLPAAIAGPIKIATSIPIDWISTALLVVMVLSAAATNAFVSRNERSLLHSYHAQERRIRKWFETFAAAANGPTVPPHCQETVLAFEDIMLNELLDFIHITSRDVIEVPG